MRRGLLDHFEIMTSAEVKVYVALLILADFNTGRVKISQQELANIVNMTRENTNRYCKRLKALKYIKIKGAKNQHDLTEITVLKYQVIHKAACDTQAQPEAQPEAQPQAQAQNPDQGKQAPNKSKEIKRNDDVSKVLNWFNAKTTNTPLSKKNPLGERENIEELVNLLGADELIVIGDMVCERCYDNSGQYPRTINYIFPEWEKKARLEKEVKREELKLELRVLNTDLLIFPEHEAEIRDKIALIEAKL